MAHSIVKLKNAIIIVAESVATIVFSSFDKCLVSSIDSEIA